MSPDEAGQEQDDGGHGRAPAPDKGPERQEHVFQAFVEEYRSNNAAAERREQKRDVWSRRIALGGLGTTALTAVLAWIGWEQFSLAQNQARVQLRPYAAVTLDEVGAATEGQRLKVRLHYDNVGNTPVYAATFNPFFAFAADRKFPADRIQECKGMSVRGSVFAKKEEWTGVSDFILNKSHLDLLNTDSAIVYFFARLCYSDVFEEINWTDVCVYWRGVEGAIRTDYCTESYNQMVSDAAAAFGGVRGWLARMLPAAFR